jgi:hypothetical protein
MLPTLHHPVPELAKVELCFSFSYLSRRGAQLYSGINLIINFKMKTRKLRTPFNIFLLLVYK